MVLLVCSLRSDVVMTHTPLEITVASMYFSLKYHVISHLMPGGMRWYADWSITEERIEGDWPRPLCQFCMPGGLPDDAVKQTNTMSEMSL